MGYINIFVSKQAYIHTKNNQLVLENPDNISEYPIEDINSIMIENLETSISTKTLSQIAEYGIATFICNQSHLPCGVVLPFCEHYQTLSQFNLQNTISKPLQKQLWQKVVKQKIENQNNILNICGGKDSLKTILSSVTSGDSTNAEATASVIYFKELFGPAFKRREDISVNSFLNYGYSILRGLVARSVVAHGFVPFLGINHCNQFNQYNLADDLMEPFRPIVDLFTKVYLVEQPELTSKIKSQIYNIVNYEIKVNNQKQTLFHAIDMYVESFAKSLQTKKLLLSEITIDGLTVHQYE